MLRTRHATARFPFDALNVQVDMVPLPDRDALASMWRELETRADRSFFLSWSWIGTWLAAVDSRPDLIIARLDGAVVALGLVQARLKIRHRVLPVWSLYLHQTGDEDQDVVTIEYNDFLIDRAHQDQARRACLQFLIDHGDVGGREVGEVILGGLDGRLREDVAALGRPVHERAEAGSAYVDLLALRQSGKPFLDTLKTSTARRIRRSMALYRDKGALELNVAADVDEALDFFERCGALHQARWTSRGKPGAFGHPFYVAFHRRLIGTALPERKVELVRVSVAGDDIGYLYNFLDRGCVYYYFSGFRFEDDNRLKPGLVCHTLCIERHREDGMNVYDFMGGDQRYKLELGQRGPDIVSLAVQRPNWMLAAERPLRRLKHAIDGVRSR